MRQGEKKEEERPLKRAKYEIGVSKRALP